MLVLADYLEQWLTQPGPPPLASTHGQALNEPDHGGIEHQAPDLSAQPGASYLPRPKAAGLGPDQPAAPASGHLLTVQPPNRGPRLTAPSSRPQALACDDPTR